MGFCDMFNKVIAISSKIDKEQVEETYIHEIIEAANALFELKLEHNVIQALAVAIHQALTIVV